MVTVDELRTIARADAGLGDWHTPLAFFDQVTELRADWRLPLAAAEAVAGDSHAALHASAAIACLQNSIILIDDVLDDSLAGERAEWGPGITANMGVALQAAAVNIALAAPTNPHALAALVNQIALDTARGQQRDAGGAPTEAEYWTVIQSKSTPFYAGALRAGAIATGADYATEQAMATFGEVLGLMVQLYDDITDAFARPAEPDWHTGANLLLLFASTHPHANRERFVALTAELGDNPDTLRDLQKILLTSGAVTYVVYHFARQVIHIRNVLAGVSLARPEAIDRVLTNQMQSVGTLLERIAPGITLERIIDELDTPGSAQPAGPPG